VKTKIDRYQSMFSIKTIFEPDHEHYEGVRRINIYLMRLVFALTFLFVGAESWTQIITHKGSWDHVKAVAFCVWAAYSALSFLGLIRPLKMLPLMLFMIFYKVIWLIVIAYPLWRANQLTGSPAEEMTYSFIWVVLPIVAVPWKYAFENYILQTKEENILRSVDNNAPPNKSLSRPRNSVAFIRKIYRLSGCVQGGLITALGGFAS
jgi:hypothetical protein